MNVPDSDTPEYGDRALGFLPNDTVPDTLAPLFRHMGEELFPELTDKLGMLRLFVAEFKPREGAPVTDKPYQRIIGTVPTSFRGVAFHSGVQPYMLYLWQRVTDAFEALDPHDRQSVSRWLDDAGLSALLTTDGPIRVERSRHIEVWGAHQPGCCAGLRSTA